MNDRRPLIEGLKAKDEIAREQDFVFGKPRASVTPAKPIASVPRRVPLSTRIREDYAKALKRASLERQLAGTEPNTLQEILEEALEAWLNQHGFLP